MHTQLTPTTAADAVARIRSGDQVFIGSGAAEPASLVEAMTARASELRDVRVFHIFTMGAAPYCDPEYAESFRHIAFFVGPNVRAAVQGGRADFMPIHLHEIPKLFEERARLDWALVQLSPPDRHGYCTIGVSADVVVAAIRNAHHVVAEVNPNMPRTWGPTMVHVTELDAIVEVDTPLPELASLPVSDDVAGIGKHVADLVRDGDCLQLGIGGIPNAVAEELRDRRHLGVHTEMISDGIVDLYEVGSIDGSCKQFMQNKIACAFAMGSRRLYDFIDDNPVMSFWGADTINDPFVIAQNDNVVAVNSAIEVDLTGQVNADSMGTRVYSGIGGQVDFIRGAARSNGGRPVIALPSTAKGGTLSRVVPMLAPGAGVVTSRGDVHYVATEWGVADLYAKGLHERARALIDLAHPDFREELERTASELKLIARKFY